MCKAVLLKLDYKKAYDRVNWFFLDKVMFKKEFGVRWRKWIIGCLSTASFSVVVNGEPKDWF